MSRTPKDSGGKGSVKFSLQKCHFELELRQPGKLLLSYLPCHNVHHTLPPKTKNKHSTPVCTRTNWTLQTSLFPTAPLLKLEPAGEKLKKF